MRAAVRPIAEAGKLGYVLFQLAPWVHFEAGLSSIWPRCGPAARVTIAVEFRHAVAARSRRRDARALSDAGLPT